MITLIKSDNAIGASRVARDRRPAQSGDTGGGYILTKRGQSFWGVMIA